MFHVPERYRKTMRRGNVIMPANGNNGYFLLPQGASRPLPLTCIASDGSDWEEAGLPPPAWEHVSVSAPGRCPTWKEMTMVKGIFWDDEDAVMELHPPRSEWVNDHPHVLHLWRPVGVELLRPPAICVGTHTEGGVPTWRLLG